MCPPPGGMTKYDTVEKIMASKVLGTVPRDFLSRQSGYSDVWHCVLFRGVGVALSLSKKVIHRNSLQVQKLQD